MWPYDKLAIIQTASILTENNPPNVANDGSPEWAVASLAYEAALPYAIEQKNWKFQTKVEVLTPLPDPPADPLYDTAFAKPYDLWHLVWIRMGDNNGQMDVPYVIVNNQIWLNRRDIIIGDGLIRAKFVYGPNDPTRDTPIFVTALQHFVMAGLYRGLNANHTEANRMWALAESMLQTAATRSDQEEGKRAIFISRQGLSRRMRRPLTSTTGRRF